MTIKKIWFALFIVGALAAGAIISGRIVNSRCNQTIALHTSLFESELEGAMHESEARGYARGRDHGYEECERDNRIIWYEEGKADGTEEYREYAEDRLSFYVSHLKYGYMTRSWADVKDAIYYLETDVLD